MRQRLTCDLAAKCCLGGRQNGGTDVLFGVCAEAGTKFGYRVYSASNECGIKKPGENQYGGAEIGSPGNFYAGKAALGFFCVIHKTGLL